MQSDLIACPADAASPEDDATILEDEGGAMDDAYEEAKEGEEEAAAGTDDEGDKRQFGIYQCLPVDDREPDWEREEPESVEEYLRRVRRVHLRSSQRSLSPPHPVFPAAQRATA